MSKILSKTGLTKKELLERKIGEKKSKIGSALLNCVRDDSTSITTLLIMSVAKMQHFNLQLYKNQ